MLIIHVVTILNSDTDESIRKKLSNAGAYAGFLGRGGGQH